MTTFVLEGKVPGISDSHFSTCDNTEVSKEDSGMAQIIEIGGETGIFVRIQSWDETKEHQKLSTLMGKHVRVTIETVDDFT